MVVLSEAQFNIMLKLSRGERVTVIPPITRRWLQRQGYITVERVGKTHEMKIELTDLGREIIPFMAREIKS